MLQASGGVGYIRQGEAETLDRRGPQWATGFMLAVAAGWCLWVEESPGVCRTGSYREMGRKGRRKAGDVAFFIHTITCGFPH